MRRRSSRFAEVIYLDNEAAVAALREGAAELLASDANVTRVYLFGSLADGTATPESDADILVVVRRAGGRFFDRGDAYREHFARADIGVGLEIFVYTGREVDRMLAAGNDFIAAALTGALTLAERE